MLHQLLEASARERPDAVAVVDSDRTVSYAELDRRANQLGHTLLAHGVAPGDRIGLYLDKSIEATVGVYGILKAGAAYVPLDPDGPPVRLATILADCGVTVLVTAPRQAPRWSALVDHGAPLRTLLELRPPEPGSPQSGAGPEPGDAAAAPPAEVPVPAEVTPPAGVEVVPAAEVWRQPAGPVAVAGGELAYLLYTSGSTGVPKGVTLSHGNALGFVSWAARTFEVGPADRLSSHAPLHFDLSTFDLFAAAYAGAAVVLVPRQAAAFPVTLAQLVERTKITIWYSVPSTLTMLATRAGLRPGDLPSLRTVLFAGEVFPVKHLRRLLKLLPRARFCNLYGPTETNVCTWYDVPRDAVPDPLPIGGAIDEVELIVAAEDGTAAPDGVPGELLVRGPTVMRGYWGDPERTAAVLVPWQGATAYRTGDLVRRDPDGTLHFLGRRDSQVKSRGYRIELGEVERAVESHPDVVECAVVAIPDGEVTNRLRTFLVVRDAARAPGRAELARHCAERIPAYMIPTEVEVVDALPRTSTGKIDRRALSG